MKLVEEGIRILAGGSTKRIYEDEQGRDAHGISEGF